MISYNLAPVPLWEFRDNLGRPLANGYMKAYRDTVRSEFKAVYANLAGTVTYTQPITFNAAGFQGPFYWASDENYYLEIYDSNNVLVRTIPQYNAPNDGGINPITNYFDLSNYVTDPQFDYLNIGAGIVLTAGLTELSNSWFFNMSPTVSGTTAVGVSPTIPGASTPPNNPAQIFIMNCSVAGSGETIKDLCYVCRDVRSFQNMQVTFGFYGASPSVANTVEVFWYQNFGTGGTPSAEVYTPIVAFTLTPSWAQYSDTFVVPSITGKVLGTNINSHSFLVFRFALDAISEVNLTNIQFNQGNLLLPFEYVPPSNSVPLQVPFFELHTNNYANKYLTIQPNKLLAWETIPAAELPPHSANEYLISNAGNVLQFIPIPVFYNFTVTSNPVNPIPGGILIPMVQTSGPAGFFSGGAFFGGNGPFGAATCLINSFFTLQNTSGSGCEFTITVSSTGGGEFRHSIGLSPGTSATISISGLFYMVPGSYIEYSVDNSQNASGSCILNYGFITILHYP